MKAGGPPAQGNLDRGLAINIFCWVTVGAATVVTILRLAIRKWITKSLWWDDYTIILAAAGNIIGAGLDSVEVHYGFGRPQYYLTTWQLIEFKKYTYGEWIQTFATLMWTKISICLFLTRIPATRALIRPLHAAVAVLLISNIVLSILWIVQCKPIDAAWNSNVKGSCFSRGQLQRIIISQAIISVISDFGLALFPIVILWKVQLRLNTKIALCCLMGVGVLTGACCLVRTVLNYQAVPTDFTYGGVTNWFWRTFEVEIGIIAACIPAMRPGYKWLDEKRKGYYYSKSRTQLTDEVRLRPRDDRVAYSTKAQGNGAEFDSATDLEAPIASHQIVVTMQIDLDSRSRSR